MLARAAQGAIWRRTKATQELRALLREYYPGFLDAFAGAGHTNVAMPDARAILAIAPTPALVRALIGQTLGGSIATLRPGSAEAAETKRILLARGLWSQYLEVGIGPDPEVFTKAPVLSSVGLGAKIGIPSFSSWNNPEPELVLIVNSTGTMVGATLGNDVNLCDVEGRSALLLGKAKDNNASSALGPFIRLFDESFTLDTVRAEEIRLRVDGTDGFTMEGTNSLARISRPFEELVSATMGDHHQYPDGFALYTGTLFAPTADRRPRPGRARLHPQDRRRRHHP
ncbi:fumarylacetoacetate hydrolase family protein [Rhodococcus sp. NPDC059968]|uniref:fumarylacetoacetate hydrolase family protein n=1 Tax=Rhodococcus sp. NPDC059968 TaxID=3347017 RepID=UPI003671B2FC